MHSARLYLLFPLEAKQLFLITTTKRLRNPTPPDTFRSFYDAFLCWRSDTGMDNTIADHLANMFQNAGLKEITSTAQHEQTRNF